MLTTVIQVFGMYNAAANKAGKIVSSYSIRWLMVLALGSVLYAAFAIACLLASEQLAEVAKRLAMDKPITHDIAIAGLSVIFMAFQLFICFAVALISALIHGDIVCRALAHKLR